MLLQCTIKIASILQHSLSRNRPILIESFFEIAGFRNFWATCLSLDVRNNFEILSLELRIDAIMLSGGTQLLNYCKKIG